MFLLAKSSKQAKQSSISSQLFGNEHILTKPKLIFGWEKYMYKHKRARVSAPRSDPQRVAKMYNMYAKLARDEAKRELDKRKESELLRIKNQIMKS